MIKEAINQAVNGADLTEDEAETVMAEIMGGEATDAQIASFITAMRIKKETDSEVYGFAKAMRGFATKINVGTEVILDTCGTGGDVTGTFNISTATAFVAAGAGITVAKHGNRSVSSKCGSADVLEELGVMVAMSPQLVEQSIAEIGIGFLFAPVFHPAMKYAIGPRREIGIRTVFNILGPLTNPAGATHQVLGVYSDELIEMMAVVLSRLGCQRALIVHGADGLDELSTTGLNRVAEVNRGDIATYDISPDELGLAIAVLDDLKGGSVSDNADMLQQILSGERGPKFDAVVMNAAAALYVSDLVGNIAAGVQLAVQTIDSGSAKAKLEQLIKFSNKHKQQEG